MGDNPASKRISYEKRGVGEGAFKGMILTQQPFLECLQVAFQHLQFVRSVSVQLVFTPYEEARFLVLASVSVTVPSGKWKLAR